MNYNHNDIVKFPGNSCPRLAISYKITLAALDFLQKKDPKRKNINGK